MDQSQEKKGMTSLIYFVLFCVCLATMNVINRYYVFMYIALGLFVLLKPRRKFYLDILPILLLFVLAISWVIFSPDSTISIFGVVKPFTYVLCYIMGSSLIKDDNEYSLDSTPYKLFYKTVFVVALGSFIHYLLNWISNFGSLSRNTTDIWSGEAMAATGQASLACLSLALAIACLFSKNKVSIKIVSIITIVLVLVYNLVLSGRTLLLLTLVILAIAFLHKVIRQKKGRLKTIVIVSLVIILLLSAYLFNVFGIKTYIEESPLFDRFFSEDSNMDLDEDDRMNRKMYYLSNFDKHLFGGVHFRHEVGFSHDLYLDTYDEAGVFAFIAVVAYVILTVWHLIKCVRDKSLPFAFRQIVLCVYVAIYIEFFIEPILQGMPWLFASFCLIDGYVAGVLRHNKMVRKNQVQEKI